MLSEHDEEAWAIGEHRLPGSPQPPSPATMGDMSENTGVADNLREATVDRQDPIVWRGKLVQTWVVFLRRDSGSGLLSSEGELGKLWVRVEDGLVLKQQMTFFGSRINFVRMKKDEAAELSKTLMNEWSKESQDLEAINKGTAKE